MVKRFKDWSIFNKVILIPIISVCLLLILIIAYLFPSLKSSLYHQKQLGIKQNVEIAFCTIESFYEEVINGKLSTEESKRLALDAIRKMRYNSSDYFWINDDSPILLMHPIQPELEGKDRSKDQDPTGKYVFLEFVNIAKKQGEGFVDYMWPRPGNTTPVPKISYVKYFKEWNWIIGTGIYVDDIEYEVSSLRNGSILFFILLIVLISSASYYIGRKISSPLSLLNKATKEIADGKFNVQLPMMKTKDEIGILHDSFEHMQEQLQHYIEDLKETTSIKEKIESELRIASDIQMGMIPKLFPAFPERKEIDIFATLVSAREVGGDLYDFFFIDDDRLCFAIGDVAGKGVPASLFMAVTRTLLRSKISKDMTTNTIIDLMNKDLAEDNDSQMFVTFYLCILDLKTGDLHFTNAGHNYPYLLKNDNTFEEIKINHGLPLGTFESKPHGSHYLKLDHGDKLFLFTDGVNEAMDQEDNEYTNERLEKVLVKIQNLDSETMVNKVLEDIRKFTNGAEQSDDITILSIEYK